MGGLFGKKTTIDPGSIGSFQVNQATYGIVVPEILGTSRQQVNIADYFNFTTIKHKQKSGGKGGSSTTNVSYTYKAAVLLALCEGPISGIGKIWVDTDTALDEYVDATATETFTVTSSQTVTVENASKWVSTIKINSFNVTVTDLGSGQYSIVLPESSTGVMVTITYTYKTPALATIGLTLFDGSIGQGVWPYITSQEAADTGWTYKPFGSTINPLTDKVSHALPYSGLAYIAGYIELNSSAGVKTYNLEIKGKLLDTGDGIDINPADGAVHVLTNTNNGLGFTDSNIHAELLAGYRLFCKASDIYVTMPLTDQNKAYEDINTLGEITNTITFWDQRKIKFIPRCEQPITANGVTYTPNTTPDYDLTADDFQPDDEGNLVTWERTDNAETYNQVTVEFTNRDNGYETETVEYQILADINERGLRPMSTLSYPWIHTKERAEYVAQQKAMESCYGRNTYKFTLDLSYSLIIPGDIETLTDVACGLNKLPVMIESVKEKGDEYYEYEAKYRPYGVFSPARYTACNSDRALLDRNVAPGNASTPLFFETPFTDGSHNVGIAVSGGDNWGGAYVYISADSESYERAGEIKGPSRYGKATTAMTTTDTSVTVQLADSDAQLLSTSATSADANATLMAIGTEWIAYETATLVSAGVYTLSGLRRGLYGSAVVAHAIDDDFLRYDSDGFLYPYRTEDIGRTIYVKLTSYNVFGLNVQDLDDVTAYEYTITGVGVISSNYTHTQSTAATVWTINHNLNRNPSVTTVDSAGNQIEGTVDYTSLDSLTITFTVAIAGYAYLN